MDPKIYISVILPVRFRGEVSYLVPHNLVSYITPGCKVTVDFAGRIYTAVVRRVWQDSADKEWCGEIAKPLQEEQCGETAEPVQKQQMQKEYGRKIEYKYIQGVEQAHKSVPMQAVRLWEQVADYYMCTVGEVYKAAYPNLVLRQEGVKARKTPEAFMAAVKGGKIELPKLSGSQKEVYDKILEEFGCIAVNLKTTSEEMEKTGESLAKKRPVLLHGVTGSGKTEVYITLANRALKQGRSVLFMVPEIAITKQLQTRLKKVFGERLLVSHSKQTVAEKSRIYKIVSRQFLLEYTQQHNTEPGVSVDADADMPNDAVVVLGTRSALFLPYANLGLVIVDEEHDSSYKQTEPAPRYQARDVAVMLAKIHNADVLLGSATPSFESEYNCAIGRFAKVSLFEKYYGAQQPEVDIIDTIWARKSRQMKGSFSQKLINEIQKVLDRGRQVIIFRNRRSYSPIVECAECGDIPKCPHCNVYLSYHKYNNTLRCHYCDYTVKFKGICTSCGLDALQYKGAGTERIEEELKELFPEAVSARFDADVAQSKRDEERVLKAFSAKQIDILVGTQMISKGFDFEFLDLVVVLQADTILGIQDFRADERALQMFSQLMGRTGRRDTRGKIIIQTNQKKHPVFEFLKRSVEEYNTARGNCGVEDPACEYVADGNSSLMATLLEERREFKFAPYVRMVKIVIKHKDAEKLNLLCAKVHETLKSIPCMEVTGPFVPAIDRVRGEWLKCFYIKFARNRQLGANKQKLLKAIEDLKAYNSIILDVDPA